jgi:hypothetical protein
VKLASIGATFITRKTLGYDLTMSDAEARRVARPIARVIARRFRVTRDFSDATDVVGTGGSVMSWLNRVIASHEDRAPGLGTHSAIGRADFAPAAPPAPAARLLSDEAAPANIAPITQDGISGDREGNPVPGTGPVKSAFLAGFEEL